MRITASDSNTRCWSCSSGSAMGRRSGGWNTTPRRSPIAYPDNFDVTSLEDLLVKRATAALGARDGAGVDGRIQKKRLVPAAAAQTLDADARRRRSTRETRRGGGLRAIGAAARHRQ